MRPPASKPPRYLQLLVATQNALGLVTLSGQKVTTMAVHEGAGMYYGITWDVSRYYAIARGGPTGLLSIANVNGVATFTDMPAPITPTDRGIGAAHQIHYNYNGRLWVTDTLKCALLCYNPVTQLWETPVEWGGDETNHLNSVWGIGGGLWITEHTRKSPYKHLRRFNYGAVDPQALELFLTYTIHLPELHQGEGQQGLHNVYQEGTTLYTLGPGHVIEIDTTAARVDGIRTLEEVTPKKHYLRGLARTIDAGSNPDDGDGYFIIGRSKALSRTERGQGSAALLCYNRNWRLLAKYDLPSEWGQVLEVRGMTHADRAHNGMTPPHLRKRQKWGFKQWEPTATKSEST